MQTRHALGVKHACGNGGNRDRRGVTGQQGLRRADLSQLGKQRLFHFHTLGRRFNHQIGGGQRLNIGDRRQSGERLFARFGAELAAGHARCQTAADALDGAGNRPGVDVIYQHRVALTGRHLGDPGPHDAAADDRDGLNS